MSESDDHHQVLLTKQLLHDIRTLRHYTDGIQGVGIGNDAVSRDQAIRRFEPNDACVSRG